MSDQMPLVRLAEAVLATLDLQQVYFRTRTPDALRASRAAERRLREMARAVLHPKQVQPELPLDGPTDAEER